MNRPFTSLCLLWATLLPLSSLAETRFVSPDGAHVPPFATWANAATNVQAAIDVCAAGDVVVMTNGIYALTATVRVTNDVTLASLNGRDAVLLDGSTLPAGSDAVFLQFGTLDGLTVSNAPRHGIKSEYGAIYNSRITHSGQTGIDSYTAPRIVANSTLLVTNTVVASSGSNGIYLRGGHPHSGVPHRRFRRHRRLLAAKRHGRPLDDAPGEQFPDPRVHCVQQSQKWAKIGLLELQRGPPERSGDGRGLRDRG